MSLRFSQSDKDKWVTSPSKPARRPPVQIPAVDNKALIEENKFTLIGRVTNPAIQKTKSLVDFFLQHWKVAGPFTGRYLGPHLFQFKFDSEKDLQLVLADSPYHFKRWMIILKRWEPIVSDYFPALIPFWITIHGLPLHFWTDVAIEAIGNDLGLVEAVDVNKGRIRVWVNGLRPLEMFLDVSLAGKIKQVELEYENLEKHCFICHSLSHDKDNCPSQRAIANTRASGTPAMSISQSHTRERLDADRRRKEDKKQSRSLLPFQPSRSQNSGQWQRSYHGDSTYAPNWRNDKDFRINYGARNDLLFQRSSTRDSNRDLEIPPEEPLPKRDFPLKRVMSQNRKGTMYLIRGGVPRGMNGDQFRAISIQDQTLRGLILILPPQTPTRRTNSPCSELYPSIYEEGNPSHERRSALKRLSLPKERVPLLQDGVANAESGRLQEVDNQYLEENLTVHLSGGSNLPSSSRNPENTTRDQYDPSQDRFPIRTLSEDRLHVSLRLGPLCE